jgi:lysyl-tRNA synthetase class II
LAVKGKLFKTKTNELTIEASAVSLITKSIRPMPDKFKVLPILRQDIDKDILI